MTQASPPPSPLPPSAGVTVAAGAASRTLAWAGGALLVLALGGLWTGWSAQNRLQQLESELVKRQEASQASAQEARVLARQAEQQARDSAARASLLETRLAEVALQRGQVEDLIRSMTRSRDENLLVDIEAGLRVALQQSALTGSAEPLVYALQSAEDRLGRAPQARLEPVRRAIGKDLDRVRSTRVSDLASLAIRLDEAIRLVDEAPLLVSPALAPASPPSAEATRARSASAAASSAGAPPASLTSAASDWLDRVGRWGQQAGASAWQEARSLIRLTRIDQPESMLVAPEQAYFLRENLKLRLLNARLGLLSRQTATAISDLQSSQQALKRYFDPQARKTQLASRLLDDVVAQAPLTQVPRPDETLAVLATLNGGR